VTSDGHADNRLEGVVGRVADAEPLSSVHDEAVACAELVAAFAEPGLGSAAEGQKDLLAVEHV
jgi:hypothetical protein